MSQPKLEHNEAETQNKWNCWNKWGFPSLIIMSKVREVHLNSTLIRYWGDRSLKDNNANLRKTAGWSQVTWLNNMYYPSVVVFKCSLNCRRVKASGCEGGWFDSLEAKKASVNHDGAEREELKLMKSWETGPLAVFVSPPVDSCLWGVICQQSFSNLRNHIRHNGFQCEARSPSRRFTATFGGPSTR